MTRLAAEPSAPTAAGPAGTGSEEILDQPVTASHARCSLASSAARTVQNVQERNFSGGGQPRKSWRDIPDEHGKTNSAPLHLPKRL